jgi:hypothetical protein
MLPRAISAVAELLVVFALPGRTRVTARSKRGTLVFQVGGWAWRLWPQAVKPTKWQGMWKNGGRSPTWTVQSVQKEKFTFAFHKQTSGPTTHMLACISGKPLPGIEPRMASYNTYVHIYNAYIHTYIHTYVSLCACIEQQASWWHELLILRILRLLDTTNACHGLTDFIKLLVKIPEKPRLH